MKLPSPIVAGSIAVGVFAGGFAIGHFITDNGGSTTKASGKSQVLGQVFSKTPDGSTSTTAATVAPQTGAPSPATTAATTAQPAAGSQSKAGTGTQTQTQTTSPPVTSTVVVSGANCGSGSASATVASQTFPRSETADTDYETDINVTVHNGIDKPIQIDSLSVHLVYQDGGTQDVAFNDAIGNVLQPGVTNNYGVALNTGKRQVATNGVSMQSFTFHTAGHPECAGRPS